MMWDHQLFLWLNFDGGQLFDSIMLFASGKLSWVGLYLLILWLAFRRYGWRGVLLTLVVIGCAVGISDIVAGIFKHTGPLKHLLPSFPVRLRPMYTPELEGMVHIITHGGKYGTVSAHASTATSIAMLSSLIINKKWFSIVMLLQASIVCYSRIYLSYHFPQDILLGCGVGVVSALVMWRGFVWGIKKIDDAKDRY